MEESILTSIKKLLGISEDYEHFDLDVMVHINVALAELIELGVGPKSGFRISSKDSKWDDFLEGEALLEHAKQYVYLSVRLVFDPPTSSFVLDALKSRLSECAWRINSISECEEVSNNE